MKMFKTLLATGLLAATAAHAQPMQTLRVDSITVSPMTKANLCPALGGSGEPATITVKHEPKANVAIFVRLFDDLSNGRSFTHGTDHILSDASGTTTIRHPFFPPCNTSKGRVDSHYKFEVKVGETAKILDWARFLTATNSIEPPKP